MFNRLTGENIRAGLILRILALNLVLLSFLSPSKALAQTSRSDISIKSLSLSSAIQYYHTSVGAQSILYSGTAHKGYTADIVGSAYFIAEDWQNGQVYFDKVLFEKVPLLYDQVKDELLTLTPDKTAIRLVTERVDRFFFAGHTFVRISSGNNSMEGFYDLLRAGRTAVLAKRKKVIHETVSGGVLSRKFLSEDKYYLKKGDHYFQVRNMKNVLEALEDKKNEIRQIFKDRKLDLRADPQGTLLALAAYYDQLNNSL